MIYFDTNVLIYSVINQSEKKMSLSNRLIEETIQSSGFLISTLSLQELIYALSILKLHNNLIDKSFSTFSKFCYDRMDISIVVEAFYLCKKVNFFKSISDEIHLKFAERHCSKLITFDKDFNKFIPHTHFKSKF